MAYPWSDIGASSPQGNARGRGPATEYTPWRNIPQDQIGARMQARDQRSIYGMSGQDVPAVSRQEIADYRPNTREIRTGAGKGYSAGGNMPRQIQPWQTTLGEATEGSSSFVGPSRPGSIGRSNLDDGFMNQRMAQDIARGEGPMDRRYWTASTGTDLPAPESPGGSPATPEASGPSAAPGGAIGKPTFTYASAADAMPPIMDRPGGDYGYQGVPSPGYYESHLEDPTRYGLAPETKGPLLDPAKRLAPGVFGDPFAEPTTTATPTPVTNRYSPTAKRVEIEGMPHTGDMPNGDYGAASLERSLYGSAAGQAGFGRMDTPYPYAQNERGDYMRYEGPQSADAATGGEPQYLQRGDQIGTTPTRFEGMERAGTAGPMVDIANTGVREGAAGDVWKQRTSGGSPIYEMGRGSSVQGGSILPRDVIQRANENMRAGGGGGFFGEVSGRASDDPRYANATNQQRIAMNVAALNADTDALRSANEAKKAATHERYGMKRSSSGQGSSAGTKWWANPGGGAAMTRNRQMERAIGRAATQRERDSIRRQYTTQRGQDMDIASDAMAQAQRRQEFAGQQDYRNRQLGVDYARMEANRRAADIGYRVDERHRLEDANRAIGMERLKEGLRGQVRPQDIFTEKGPFPDMDPAAASYMIGIMKQNPNQDPIQLGKNIQAFMESNDGKWNREAFDKDFQAKMKAGRIGG